MGDGGEVLHVGEKAPNTLAETFKVKAFSNQLADNSNTTGLKGQKPKVKLNAQDKITQYRQMIEDAKQERILNERKLEELYKGLEKNPDWVPGYIQTIRSNRAREKQRELEYIAFGGNTYYPKISHQIRTDLEALDREAANRIYLDLDHGRSIYYRLNNDFVRNNKTSTIDLEAPIIKETLALTLTMCCTPIEAQPQLVLSNKREKMRFVVDIEPQGLGHWNYGRVNLEELYAYRQMHKLTKALKGFDLPPKPKLTRKPKTSKIEPNPAFGEHFAEFEGKGAQAVAKLLQEKRGQVAGAFYREDLGYIDLVWGNVGVGKTKGIGLSKILDKHADDFKGFVGNTPEEKVASGIKKIIDQGELKEVDGVKTIYLTHQQNVFKVGLSQGWDHEGNNHWVITAYKVRTPSVQLSDQAQPSKGMGYSSPKGEHDSTKPPLKVQARPWGNGVSAEPEEIVKIVRQTFGPVAMQRLEFSIKHHREQIGEYKERLKRLSTEHEQMLKGTHPYHTLDPEHNQAIIEAIKKRENTAKLAIESFQAKIQTAQNTLEAYRIWKEVKDNLTPLEELKINFYNTERLARENVTGASGNARLIERLQGEVSTQKYLAGLAEENLNIWSHISHNFPTINDRLKKLNVLVKKMRALDENSITPKMQATLQELEQKGTQQQKDLAEMEKLFNAVVATWEKIHNKKAPNAHFNPHKPKSRD